MWFLTSGSKQSKWRAVNKPTKLTKAAKTSSNGSFTYMSSVSEAHKILQISYDLILCSFLFPVFSSQLLSLST